MAEYKIEAKETKTLFPKTYHILTEKRESAQRYSAALLAQGHEVRVTIGGKVYAGEDIRRMP